MVALVVGLVATGLPLVRDLAAIEQVPLDVAAARARLAGAGSADTRPGRPHAVTEGGTGQVGPAGDPGHDAGRLAQDRPPPSASPEGGDGQHAILVVGSDQRVELVGARADVLLVFIVPDDGSGPVMFSLPRDLWLDDPCGPGNERINAAFNGCGTVNGFELTSLVVEDFTGLVMDGVVAIDFGGFERVVDAAGGMRICVEHPVREGSRLALPAGCSRANGTQALGWVRSRWTEEFVDGHWRPMTGVNDLTRNRRQQDLVVQLLDRLGGLQTEVQLHELARGLRDSVQISEGLSVFEGVRRLWSLRGRGADVRRFELPVRDLTTSDGARVLLPVEPFATTLERETGLAVPD